MRKTVWLITLLCLGVFGFVLSVSAEENTQTVTKTEYFAPRNITSTATVTGPITVHPLDTYNIVVTGTTNASMCNWRLYENNVLIAGSALVFGSSVNKTFPFTKAIEGNYTYEFWFRGIQGAHNWPDFTKVAITVSVVPALPSAPSNLVATAFSSTQINLAWTNNATNADGIKIERRTSLIDYTTIATTTANATSYSDTELLPSTQYDYRIRASNLAGDSDYSNEATATTFVPPVTELNDVVTDLFEDDAFKNNGSYNAVLSLVENAQDSFADGNTTSGINQLEAIVTSISNEHANRGIDDDAAQYLINILRQVIITKQLPATMTLYLVGAPTANQIWFKLPDGSEAATTLTGQLTVNLTATANPNIVSLSVLNSAISGTPITVGGVDLGALDFVDQPANPSIGTLDLTTGWIQLIERQSLTSQSGGIVAAPIETVFSGELTPLSLTDGIMYLVGSGVVPSGIPFLGGGKITGVCTRGPDKNAKPTEISWTAEIPDTVFGPMTVSGTGNSVILTFKALTTTSEIKLSPQKISPTGTTKVDVNLGENNKFSITVYQGDSAPTGTLVLSKQFDGSWRLMRFYGKGTIIDVAPTTTPTVACTIDFIQFVSYTTWANGTWDSGTLGWTVDDPKRLFVDPTYNGITTTSAGTKILYDTPGPEVSPGGAPEYRNKPTLTTNMEFNIWIIRKCEDVYEVLGFFEMSFTVILRFDPVTGKVTSREVKPIPVGISWTGGSPDPNSRNPGTKAAGERYYTLLSLYHQNGWPQPAR